MSTATVALTLTTIVSQTQTTGIVFLVNFIKWIYLAVAILGFVSNVFVMYVILRSRKLRQQPRNWLIFNRSLADLGGAVMVLAIPFRTISTDLQVSLLLLCLRCYNTSHYRFVRQKNAYRDLFTILFCLAQLQNLGLYTIIMHSTILKS